MFRLPRVFHITHVVDDFDDAMRWYREVFNTSSDRGNAAGAGTQGDQATQLGPNRLILFTVGTTVLMPLQAAPGSAPDRYRERMGPRLHSLALDVLEPQDLVDHLTSLGYDLTNDMGGPVTDPREEIWTRPKQSPLLFEFFEPRDVLSVPKAADAGLTPSYWRDEHPLGLHGAHYTCVTDDSDKAAAFLVDGLHGRVLHEAETAHGTRSLFVELSDQVMVEVARPVDPSGRAAADLTAGARFHAVTFRVGDLDRAVDHLEAKGIHTERVAAGHVVLEAADTLGMLLRLTDRDVVDW